MPNSMKKLSDLTIDTVLLTNISITYFSIVSNKKTAVIAKNIIFVGQSRYFSLTNCEIFVKIKL